MNSFSSTDTGRREYQLKAWQRLFLLPFGMLFLILGIFFTTVIRTAPGNSALSFLPALFFDAFGVYMLAMLIRSRLVLDGSRIEVRGAFQTKSADLSAIEGYRTINTRNGSYTQLQLKQGMGTISIPNSFDTDDTYRAWLRQIPDFDQLNRKEILDEIAKETELGSTPEERLAALPTAKTWAVFLSIVTGVSAAALAFAPEQFHFLSAVLLGLAPIVAACLLLRSPLLYALFKAKADPRAELSFVLILAGFGLIINSKRVHFVSIQPLLLFIVPVGVLYLAALMSAVRKTPSRPGTFIALLLFSGMYSFGLGMVADTIADHAPATTHRALVVGKRVSHGRSTSYYLTLSPWGPFESTSQIRVSSRTYRSLEPGDEVCLRLHPGSLHVPWFQTTACTGQDTPLQP